MAIIDKKQKRWYSKSTFDSLDKSTIPVGTEIQVAGEIEEADLTADLQTKINGKLTAPTTPTADSVVTLLANGTVGTKALSEFGGKLYKHSITIRFPDGNEIPYIMVIGLLPHDTEINTIALLVENSTLLADIANVQYAGLTTDGGGGVFTGVQYVGEQSTYMLTYKFGGSGGSLNLAGFTTMTDTVTEL